MWSTPLKSEDLRRIPDFCKKLKTTKKKEIFKLRSFVLEVKSFSLTQPFIIKSKMVNNKIVLMKMYRHATRAETAEIAAEKNGRPASAKKLFEGALEGVTK